MPKFRKKPVEVEAIQFTGGATNIADVLQFTGIDAHWRRAGAGGEIVIHTLEGEMAAFVGDWIIRGIKGELCPCKPDIFAATYERVSA